MSSGRQKRRCPHSDVAFLLGNTWLNVKGRLDVGGAVTVQARAGDRLREDDADWHEDSATAGSEGHGHFHARAFAVLIPAAEAETALRQVFADHDFFGKAAAANARQDACFDACTITAGEEPVPARRAGGAPFLRCALLEGF